jgi:putative two-component system response regulator
MLKRIAVLGAAEDLYQAAAAARDKKEVQIVALAAGSEMPAAVVAAIAGLGDVGAALDAALILGTRNEELLRLFAEAVDCREGFAPGSSVCVMEHAARFARALGLSPDDQLTLERGALLRDLGKMRIPNAVLLKAGALTYDEWSLVQQHPHLGAELALGTSALKDTAAIVRNHHECYDGDGYPDGLERDAIPYLARIVKILDVYCAMTSPRHYRKGYSSHEETVEYLRTERGKHFDPDLVDVFISAHIGQAPASQ